MLPVESKIEKTLASGKTFPGAKFFSLLVLALVGISLHVSYGAEPQPDCSLTREWKEAAQRNLTGAQTIAERVELQRVEYETRIRAGELIFDEYLRGRLAQNFVKSCGGDSESQALLGRSVSAAFLKGSLRALKSSGVPALVRLSELAEKEAESTGVFFFKALGNRDETPIELGPRKAGFHRGRQSLFMDFQAIAPEEWFFIFVHELTHRLDPKLNSAIQAYGDTAAFRFGFELQTRMDRGETVSSHALEPLRSLLFVGLDRGLLAEYRSWTFCLSVYEAGKKASLWKEIGWVNQILAQREKTESLDRFTFRFLDPRFMDPIPEGFFALPIVRSEIASLRQELRESTDSPDLGLLGDLLIDRKPR